ncbi:glutaredoxin family protein [Marinobacterium jannaschii]|uniref:glutaredoxin family protein n=1 Tax=Marinobacterium jannaschii TaxID=64970 RepID=UPI00047FBF6D|nr:glutathione S-transferase N-terminal domain-containing protein [Marinobacterium jannaschii]
MKLLRWVIGRIILLLNFIFSPRAVKREETEQARINERTRSLALYQFEACPFCVKVRRSMKRNALDIELRDARNDQQHRQTLEQQGGRVKVPCLRIEKADGQVEWMYESGDIINYLESEVVKAA